MFGVTSISSMAVLCSSFRRQTARDVVPGGSAHSVWNARASIGDSATTDIPSVSRKKATEAARSLALILIRSMPFFTMTGSRVSPPRSPCCIRGLE